MIHHEVVASEGIEVPRYHYPTSISYLSDDEERAAAQLAIRTHSESGLQLRYHEHDVEGAGEYSLSASSGSSGREHQMMHFMPHDPATFSHETQTDCSVTQGSDPLTLSTSFRPAYLSPISRAGSPDTQPRVFHSYPTFGFFPSSTSFHDAPLGNSPVEHDVSLRPIYHTPENNDLGRRLPHPSPFVQHLGLSPHAFSPPFLSDNRSSFTSFPNLVHHEPQMANLGLSEEAPAGSEETARLEWQPTEQVGPPIQSDDSTIVPTIEIDVTKGFFMTELPEASWTCYRRNYFSVSTWFHLNPSAAGQLLVLGGRQIQAFSVRLAAVQDGPGAKNVELIVYTPKRDQGKKFEMKYRKLSPSSPANRNELSQYTGQYNYGYQFGMPQHQYHGSNPTPILHLQDTDDAPQGTEPHNHVNTMANPFSNTRMSYQQGPHIHHFERIQFKNATANNGKRRASQQYFHLLIELYADVRVVGSPQPEWRKVAFRMSDKLVVRGRSPSHYDRGEQRFEPHNGGNGGGSERGSRGSRGSGYGASRSTGGYTQARYPTQSYQPMYLGGNIGGFRQLEYDVKPIKHSPTNSSSSSSGSEYKESPPGDLSPQMFDVKGEEVQMVADHFENRLDLDGSPEARPTLSMWTDSQHPSEMHYSSSYGSDRCTPPSVKSETRSTHGMIPLSLPLPPSHQRQLSQPIPDAEYMDERGDQGYASHGYYHDLEHPDFGF